MDPVPLDEKIVEKFQGKTLAVIGYEADQVMRTEDGDLSVPITHAYNHHYCAYMSGSLSELRQVSGKIQRFLRPPSPSPPQETWLRTTE